MCDHGKGPREESITLSGDGGACGVPEGLPSMGTPGEIDGLDLVWGAGAWECNWLPKVSTTLIQVLQ